MLADQWARARGGYVLALSVDHGLRAGAAKELAHVARLCAERGIDHRILTADAPLDRRDQAAARDMRYRLLDRACAAAGVIHLLVGHTADDQAETVVLRQQRASGRRGLSGMAAVRALDNCRVLRPLLAMGRAEAVVTCAAFGVDPVEDPSNRDRRYARVRVRQRLSDRPVERDRLLIEAAVAGIERRRDDQHFARLLARFARIDPAGWARVDAVLIEAPDGAEALDRLVSCIGGRAYSVGQAACRRALVSLATGKPRVSLGGCIIGRRAREVVICREAGRVRADTQVEAGGSSIRWDGRFFATAGTPGVISKSAEARPREGASIPALAARSLPCLVDETGRHPARIIGTQQAGDGSAKLIAAFCPRNMLAPAAFAVVTAAAPLT
jgi:tRNA(Ile)-lysidine synthase